MATNPHISGCEDRASLTCHGMDVTSTLRLALTTVRPFLLGKVKGAVRSRRAMHALRQRAHARGGRVWTPTNALLGLRRNVVPTPSHTWIAAHGGTLRRWADGIMQGRLPVYGANMYRRWNTDQLSGYEWSNTTWFGDCLIAEPEPGRPRGVDIRVPHEVGRCHHWPALALASVLYPEARDAYVAQLEADIASFIEQCPPQYGPQWTIAMGVGIRAANLALACDWLASADALSHTLEQRAAAMLIDHAEHLEATIEWAGGMRTSHYLGNMLGLLAVGTYLQGDSRAERWRSEAAEALTREWNVQFLDDGMSFEASTGYHRHIVDMMVLAGSLMRHHGPLPAFWTERLRRSMQALHDIAVDGVVNPAVGDDDDGMAIKLLSYEPDMSWTFDAANLLGAAVDTTSWRTRSFDAFGLYLWHHGRCRTSLRCGPIGQWGKGGHAHNDQLSLTFSVDGQPVIIDPGVVCYGADPQRRNRDRSTVAHATLAPVDMEQNQWPDGTSGLFWMFSDRAKARIIKCGNDGAVAEHRGFGRRHRRSLSARPDGITVADSWDGMPSHPADIVIPLRAGLRIDLADNEAHIRDEGLHCTLRWSNAAAVIERSVASAGYGRSVDTLTIKLRCTASTVSWSIDILP